MGSSFFKRTAALFLGLALSFSLLCPARAEASELELRGVWVSTVYNLDYPSRAGLSKAQLRQEADDIIENAASLGFNAVFLQVRPCADSFFPSDIFPWSAFLSGVQGQAPDGGFDPLAYFAEKCHEKGLQLHCWLNPYRVTRKAASSKEEALASLSPDHPAVKHPELTVFHSDGCLYFDPGIPEGRRLILSGVEELIDKYPIDGIHFDDYFYPSADFEDENTYRLYGQDFSSAEDFRRQSVTDFVASVHEAVKRSGKDISFGISPFGIWANSDKNPEGSDTVGNQSYYSHYADSLTWVRQELVDYIAPQLYWSVGSREGEFKTLLDWWLNATKGTKVKLYIGQAAYRMLEADISSPWYGTGELAKQLALMREGGADGTIMFRYSSIMKHRPLYWFIRSTFAPEERDKAPSAFAVTMGREKYVTDENIYIGGSADSSAPLYINGRQQETNEGFFGLLCPLKMGLNTIWVENGGSSERLEIYRVAQRASDRKTMTSPMPQKASYSPEKAEEVIGVKAPGGAKVFAFTSTFNTELSENQGGVYSPSGTLSDFEGHVLYSCEKNGLLTLKISPGSRQNAAPRSAAVTSDICDIYYTADKSDGASGFLTKGMTFDVEDWQNGMAYNKNIGFVSCDDISLDFENEAPTPSLTDISLNDSRIIFSCGPSSAVASVEGESLRLTFPKAKKGFLFESPLFSSVSLEETDGGLSYLMTPSAPLSGFELTMAEDKIIVDLSPASNETPVVLIDPGHGGDATGALGLKDGLYEKEINLQSALILKEQLEALGIDVLLTREEDRDISLQERLALARDIRPDLLISIHSNSAARNVDGNMTSGSEIYIKNGLSRPVADAINARLKSAGTACSVKEGSRLYMCRSTVCPSLLLENGYMINPGDMAALADSSRLSQYYAAVAQGIYDYLSK